MITTHPPRPALAVMYAGLALSMAALAVPYVDHATANVLASHLRHGYPAYSPARIDSAVTVYLIYLSVVGVLGIACWLATIRAVQTGQRWARPAATVAFTLGTSIALTNLLIRDTSGDTGLPPLLGWTGLLPGLAGLVAITLLGKERHELRR
jgi:hypothetical protein